MTHIKTACRLLLILSVMTGIVYPLAVTVIATTFFPRAAAGSLLTREGKIIGSKWIGQSFTDAKYFWGRPSATPSFPYNALASSGSNFGPSNPYFLTEVAQRIKILHDANPNSSSKIPVELVTASGSGLDPDITPEGARYQIPRVAQARGLSEAKVETLVASLVKKRTLGVLGEPRVNVLELNLKLDELH